MESTNENKIHDEKCEEETQLAVSRTVDCENLDEKIETRLLKEDETDMSSDSGKGTPITAENKDENKKLVNQEESFEELPYVPTTLPLERYARDFIRF